MQLELPLANKHLKPPALTENPTPLPLPKTSPPHPPRAKAEFAITILLSSLNHRRLNNREPHRQASPTPNWLQTTSNIHRKTHLHHRFSLPQFQSTILPFKRTTLYGQQLILQQWNTTSFLTNPSSAKNPTTCYLTCHQISTSCITQSRIEPKKKKGEKKRHVLAFVSFAAHVRTQVRLRHMNY